jgi:hypothetical protein
MHRHGKFGMCRSSGSGCSSNKPPAAQYEKHDAWYHHASVTREERAASMESGAFNPQQWEAGGLLGGNGSNRSDGSALLESASEAAVDGTFAYMVLLVRE